MENIKKYWNDNLSDKAKIIIVSFFTFLSFICASMTNSIVSAYDVKLDNKTYNYKYYVKYTTSYRENDSIEIRDYIYYFNDYDSFDLQNGSIVLNYKNNNVEHHYYCKTTTKFDSGKTTQYEVVSKNSTVFITYTKKQYVDSVSNISTNNQSLYSTIHSYNSEVKYNPELISPEKMKVLTGTISKTTTILIPIGLVIFGLILGIYLIKRLVALFL